MKKVKVGNDQEMVQSERKSDSKNREREKNKIDNQVLILRKHIISRAAISQWADIQLAKLN